MTRRKKPEHMGLSMPSIDGGDFWESPDQEVARERWLRLYCVCGQVIEWWRGRVYAPDHRYFDADTGYMEWCPGGNMQRSDFTERAP